MHLWCPSYRAHGKRWAIYHPRNQYLLQLDSDASDYERYELAQSVESEKVFQSFGNFNVVGKGYAINQLGTSALAATLHAAALLLRLSIYPSILPPSSPQFGWVFLWHRWKNSNQSVSFGRDVLRIEVWTITARVFFTLPKNGYMLCSIAYGNILCDTSSLWKDRTNLLLNLLVPAPRDLLGAQRTCMAEKILPIYKINGKKCKSEEKYSDKLNNYSSYNILKSIWNAAASETPENGHQIDKIGLWNETHFSKRKNDWVDPRSKDIYDRVVTLRESSSLSEDEIFAQMLTEKCACFRGMGVGKQSKTYKAKSLKKNKEMETRLADMEKKMTILVDLHEKRFDSWTRELALSPRMFDTCSGDSGEGCG
ncbi:hypothetical protein FNV43_RR16285 [Rhamnella rubrinervis]|uniref:Uncharacterized protein n=1 Tax=Rhamnella rubrinervis TaxID=2594499 RepID=A0A8K0MBQ1_9ROSA|nr:hypothetical protein FNV43_RR16285 [Rhamnella rubrinervis]